MQQSRTVSKNEIPEQWYIVDATGQRIGKLASVVAQYLLGKHNTYTRKYHNPNVKIVVVNASKLDIHPRKVENKLYTRYSGYPGGLTKLTLGEVMEKHPERVIESAIWGMLPKNRRGNAIYSNLHVVPGTEHKYTAQQPVALNIENIKI